MKRHKQFSYLQKAIIVVFILILILNILAPYTADDFSFMEHSGYLDLWKREFNYWFTWSGRSVAGILVRHMVVLPKPVYDVIASGIYVLYLYLICRLAAPEVRASDFLIAAGLHFLFMPVFGQTVLWVSGACNYLFTAVLILLFLLQMQKPSVPGWRRCAGLFVLGVLAGWTNENTGGAMIFLELVLIGKNLLKNRDKAAGFVGSLIGFGMLVLAPGNAVRAAQDVTVDLSQGGFYSLVHDLNDAFHVIGQPKNQAVLWVIAVILLALCFSDRERRKRMAAYMTAAFLCVFVIVALDVQVLYDRTMFGSSTLLLVAIVIGLHGVREAGFETVKKCSLAVLAFCCFCSYGEAGLDLFYTHHLNSLRESAIAAQKERGLVNMVAFPITSEFLSIYNPLDGLVDVTRYQNLWVNKAMAQYYGVNTIVGVSMEKYQRIYQNGDVDLMNIIDLSDLEEYLSLCKQKGYTIIAASTKMTDELQPYAQMLESYGFEVSDGYLTGYCLADGTVISGEVYEEGGLAGHYSYASSSQDPSNADIMIDGQEYTNNQAGISLVVFDPAGDHAVDSITIEPDQDYGIVRSDDTI